MQEQASKPKLEINEEAVTFMFEGIEMMLDSLELMSNPTLLRVLHQRVKDVKENKIKTKSFAYFERFLKDENSTV